MSDNNLSQKKQKQYEEYVKAVTPVHSLPLNMCKAFFTGGVICVVGQVILNYADNLRTGQRYRRLLVFPYPDPFQCDPHRM